MDGAIKRKDRAAVAYRCVRFDGEKIFYAYQPSVNRVVCHSANRALRVRGKSPFGACLGLISPKIALSGQTLFGNLKFLPPKLHVERCSV